MFSKGGGERCLLNRNFQKRSNCTDIIPKTLFRKCKNVSTSLHEDIVKMWSRDHFLETISLG